MTSYLTGRTQYVRYRGEVSTTTRILRCTPGFGTRTRSLPAICSRCYRAGQRVWPYSSAFADDLQIYGHSVSADTQELVAHMTTCIEQVCCWMASNRLHLNLIMTELIWLSSPHCTNLLSTSPIHLFGTVIQPSQSVQDFWVIVDSDLSLSAHVSHIASVCFYYLHQLRLVRRSLTMDAAHALVWAMIHSRLDYCNRLLAGLPTGHQHHHHHHHIYFSVEH